MSMRQINISGPDGNAFVLMGIARNWAKQLGKSDAERDQMLADMRKGDYQNLLAVFRKNFGEIAELVEDEPEDDDES